jgi:glycosyltransferase involved in cell wall biosynthesis
MCYRNKTIGIVVPAYNEALLIGDTLRSIPTYADKIYVVDDSSEDETSEIVGKISKEDPRVICIKHDVNKGVGGAIITGYKKALEDGIDIVAIMAGDNQMDPKYLSDLINPIIEGSADFTKGNRLKPGYWYGMSVWRLFGNVLLNLLTKIASGHWNIDDPQNGYVAINSCSLKKLDLDNLYKGYAFENDMMIKANVADIKMANIRIPARYGKEKSKITYNTFIIKTSMFLFYSFLWRIWNKYLKRGHPIGFLYIIGCCGVIIGAFVIVTGNWIILISSLVTFILSCIWEFRQNKSMKLEV